MMNAFTAIFVCTLELINMQKNEEVYPGRLYVTTFYIFNAVIRQICASNNTVILNVERDTIYGSITI